MMCNRLNCSCVFVKENGEVYKGQISSIAIMYQHHWETQYKLIYRYIYWKVNQYCIEHVMN